ncbi:MAG: hypothetical protein AAF909_06675 [Pseudomonadota bacterium]
MAVLSAGLAALAGAPHALLQFVSAAPLKTAGVVLAIALAGFVWLWIGHLRSENADLRAERVRLHHDVALHRALLKDRENALAALAEAQTKLEARRRAAALAREEAIDAPEMEDGVLAPVLRRALERLR